MLASHIMELKDQINGLIVVSDMLRFDGYYSEARDLDKAAESMEEMLERLRKEAANDG